MAEDGRNEGTRDHQRRLPRRAFPAGIAAIVAGAVIITAIGAWSAGHEPVQSAARGIVAGLSATPDAEETIEPTVGTTDRGQLTQPPSAVPPTEAPIPAITATATPVVPSVSATPTIDGAWSATPIYTTPEPSGPLSPAAMQLRASIEARYGVRVLVDGQSWGDDGDSQLRNLGAVEAALANIPANLLASVNANGGGALTVLSNSGGRTEDGWQPYGDREANFYCNEDRDADGQHAANQVVLQPGSNAQTIAHEIMHAWQTRNSAPGDYISALLTPDMKSFMAATGWTQLASDDDVRAAGGSWASLNAMFSYNGRATTYVNEYGTTVSLFAPNPLEALAEAGGLYYAHSAGTTLPDWPEYWAWFAANAG